MPNFSKISPYAQCQSNLLSEEFRQKKSSVRVLRIEFDNLRLFLQQKWFGLIMPIFIQSFWKTKALN